MICKALSLEGELVTGYYWKSYPYTAISSGTNKDRHYLRFQKNWDWNLSTMVDVEIRPETLKKGTGFHYENQDIFEGDRVNILDFDHGTIIDAQNGWFVKIDGIERLYPLDEIILRGQIKAIEKDTMK